MYYHALLAKPHHPNKARAALSTMPVAGRPEPPMWAGFAGRASLGASLRRAFSAVDSRAAASVHENFPLKTALARRHLVYNGSAFRFHTR